MNFRIDIEMTPDEMRRVLGLPDVAALQQEMIDKVREQMEAGVEGYDPLTLLKPYLNSGIGSMESFQKLLFGMMSQYGNDKRDAD
ncbi:MAG: hypothetical protein GYB41_13690 [Oceanospirillales bacterium]|uniref:Uncharacterized protein n=1 Tax=Marinobacterium halophilum TaxID=267374 RepID=A0A2P8EZK1_9GAMM|nr:DUF6489 family protein [Marinobacterium halophilum]MBR9829671.1 hypothetical protein [Oceanospirillales bacterium]PSL14889.1 hypothetical protein CLV44_10665 [Marinobacterium halophilum]